MPLAVYVYVEVAEGASKPVGVLGLFCFSFLVLIIGWRWVSFEAGGGGDSVNTIYLGCLKECLKEEE
jgi:hypothetical protein